MIEPRFLSEIRWIGPSHQDRSLSQVGIIVILERGRWWIIGVLLHQQKGILESRSGLGMVYVESVEVDIETGLVQPGVEHVLDAEDSGNT